MPDSLIQTVQTEGPFFKDEFGRILMLRGVNLGGSSKVPYTPDDATQNLEVFFDHRNVSFVGRPFPLDEADEHFKRLKRWGLTFVRFLITWEAVEHQGPGIYDEEYLDYLHAVILKANEYGINVFIDPHHDVWSRFTGGDGAPGWTLETAGFDITHFTDTNAAVVDATYGGRLPGLLWPTNGSKLAAATMSTLFFGGNDFAPKTQINGEPAQDFLQSHYIKAIRKVAERLKDLPNVVGYDTLNEPISGYIGWADLNEPGEGLSLGPSPTPFQSMLLGMGLPQVVNVWKLGMLSVMKASKRMLNASKMNAWREGSQCIWRQNEVWDFDHSGTPHLLRPNHFSNLNGREVNFVQDYYRPFANRFAQEIREADPRSLIFIESEAGNRPPVWGKEDADRIIYAPHWYDGLVLVKKKFSPYYAVDFFTHGVVLTRGAVTRSFINQLAGLKNNACQYMGNVPTLLGEFGIPFDMEDAKAFKSTDFSTQTLALDRSFQAIEANLMNCTIWNYTADNTNLHGDQWNHEDFSIFSNDQRTDKNDINSGGRALNAVVRPYPYATAGKPISMAFDLKRRIFKFKFKHDSHITAPTEIFVPEWQYPFGYHVKISDGTFEIENPRQMLIYRHDEGQTEHTILIMPVEKL